MEFPSFEVDRKAFESFSGEIFIIDTSITSSCGGFQNSPYNIGIEVLGIPIACTSVARDGYYCISPSCISDDMRPLCTLSQRIRDSKHLFRESDWVFSIFSGSEFSDLIE